VKIVRRILVCGSRTFGVMPMRCVELEQRAEMQQEMIRTFLPHYFTRGDVLIHGAALGADSIAAEWAKANGHQIEAFPADWDFHGKSAGPIRNKAMLASGVSFCLAFVDKPLELSRGTSDMVRRCLAASVPVVVTMDLR
jgi:hypothetical protein